MTSIRTRWAALGAAVAVTLGAGGISLGHAAIGTGDKPVFVGITPCRLVDTRPGDSNVGGRTSPLGANDTLTLQVIGSTGQCTDIPADAVAAAMNVTAIQGSTRSYLSVYPADAALPNASNLNWNGGDPPTPNKVDVGLSAAGEVKITNNAGTVHVAADLVGYYIDHTHDDRYYTETEVDAALDHQKFVNIDTMKNVEGWQANRPIGGPLVFDASLVLPPDYTAGTDLTFVVNVFKLDFEPRASCTITMASNFLYGMRPSTGEPVTPSQLVGGGVMAFDAVQRDVDGVEFTMTGSFQPGDSVTFGVFPDPSTCTGSDVGVHSAAVYYD